MLPSSLVHCIVFPGLAFFSDTYHIQITPSISMFDENISIIAHGFKSHEMITIQAWTQYSWRQKEVLFVSHGHFYADQNGQLDLQKIPSLGGSYKGIIECNLEFYKLCRECMFWCSFCFF